MEPRNKLTGTRREEGGGKGKGEGGEKGKKEGTPPFTTAWAKLGNILLSEISQVVKDKYHMILPITRT